MTHHEYREATKGNQAREDKQMTKMLTDTKYTARVSMTERESGKRAAFHVYYRNHKGKLMFDPSFEADVDAAVEGMTTAFLVLYGKRGKEFQIVGVAALDQTVSVSVQ